MKFLRTEPVRSFFNLAAFSPVRLDKPLDSRSMANAYR